MLQLQQLSPEFLQYKNNPPVSDIWQQQVGFVSGSYVHLQAPSGSGKSTLVQMLYGMPRPYTGTILLNNQDLRQLDAEALAEVRRNRLSIVFQDLRLFPELTVMENLQLKQLQTNTVAEATIKEWAERLNISSLLQRNCNTLSMGERQRVAIIRALCQPFEWLLMDEPFSHLDQGNIQLAAALILDRVKELNAGFILADLEHDNHFPYTRQMKL
jgi:putative ABC transport system ATP-binding protein